MKINQFHAELAALQFIHIDDPIISQRTHPTVSDLTQIFIRGTNSNDQLVEVRTKASLNLLYVEQTQAYLELTQLYRTRMDLAKEQLKELRSVETAIAVQRLADLEALHPDDLIVDHDKWIAHNMHQHADLHEAMQLARFTFYRKFLGKASHETLPEKDPDTVDVMTEFSRRFDAIMTGLDNSYADTVLAGVESQEHLAMVELQSTVHRCISTDMIQLRTNMTVLSNTDESVQKLSKDSLNGQTER